MAWVPSRSSQPEPTPPQPFPTNPATRPKLQNPDNRREILADAKLEPVFGKKKVTMFEMNKHLNQHLK
jgi:hypothetical protein